MTYDLAIIGGGPGGVAAGVYASRKNLKTIIIAHEIGGQSTVSQGVQNWIGTIEISGLDLAKALKAHLKAYAGEYVEIKEGACVTKVEAAAEDAAGAARDGAFTITTDKGDTYTAKTVLVTSGAYRRKLEVKGAEKYDQKGLTYCASCDGPLFTDKDVVVIGGGNAGFETAAQLLAYTKSVTLLHRSDEFKADPVTVKKVLENPKMTAIKNAGITEVKGEAMVNGVTYKVGDETHELATEGVFVEIGLVPSTGYIKDLVDLDDYNRIKVDARSQQTSMKGIWAAGDCTDELYHQNNIAAGDAVKALEDIYNYLHAR